MTYKELKKLPLSKETFDIIKKNIDNIEEKELLKYINYLRYLQFNDDKISFVTLLKILNITKIYDLEYKYENDVDDSEKISFGDTEDIKFEKPIIKNTISIKIKNETYNVLAQLQDDFEDILIVEKDKKLYKYGFIENNGKYYIYSILEESDENNKKILNADVKTKINIIAYSFGDETIRKTVTKKHIDKNISKINFILTNKTLYGVTTPVECGTYLYLKVEKILNLKDSIKENKLEEQTEEKEKLTFNNQMWFLKTKDEHIIEIGYGVVENEFILDSLDKLLKNDKDYLYDEDNYILDEMCDTKKHINQKICNYCGKILDLQYNDCVSCLKSDLRITSNYENTTLNNLNYEKHEKDNKFILVPKKDITRIWFETIEKKV